MWQDAIRLRRTGKRLVPSIKGIPYISLSVRNVRRSADWYRALLQLQIVRERLDETGCFGEVLLREPKCGLEIGLIGHRENPGEPFRESRTGLDHVEFGVQSRADLDAWVTRLDQLR